MKNGYYTGHVGQLDKIFLPQEDVIAIIRTKHNIRDFKGLVKLGIQAPVGTRFVINGQSIKIGATGIYELDCTVNVKQLYFETETEALVDYIY